MFTMLSSLIFASAAAIAVSVVMSTLRENRSRIADALQGRPPARA